MEVFTPLLIEVGTDSEVLAGFGDTVTYGIVSSKERMAAHVDRDECFDEVSGTFTAPPPLTEPETKCNRVRKMHVKVHEPVINWIEMSFHHF